MIVCYASGMSVFDDKSLEKIVRRLSKKSASDQVVHRSPSLTKVFLTESDEGEFETLVNQYNTGRIQPRSGPPYPVDRGDSFGMRSMKLSSYDLSSSSRPTINDTESRSELAAGNLPLAMVEFDRLIDPADPVSVTFQSKMMNITNRLQTANYGAVQKEFRFVIADQPDINAGIYSSLTPPVIYITKGAIENLETEDELAGLIAHELTHRNVFEQTDRAKVTNLEEAGADVWAVHLLQKAGYAPTSMLSMIDKLYDTEHKRRRKSAFEKEDPHPPYNIRKRNVEDAVAYYEMKTELRTETTARDEALIAEVSAVHHRPFILQKYEERNGGDLPPNEQAAFLLELWNEELKDRSPDRFMARFNDFEDLLSTAAQREGESTRFDPLVKAILDFEGMKEGNASCAKRLFKTISKAYGITHQYDDDGHSYRPIGPLEALSAAMDGFINAADQESAEAHAKTINQIAPQYNFSGAGVLSRIRWPDFKIAGIREIDQKLKAGESCALAWAQHEIWAKTSSDVAGALERFYLHDTAGPKTSVAADCIQRKGIEWGRYGYNPHDHLEINEQGQITAHKVKRIKRKKPEPKRFDGNYAYGEGRFLQARDEEAEELLKGVDWSRLQTDFWGLVEEHKNQLMPQVTSENGGDLFQKVFCERCGDLLKSGNQQDKENIIEFFTSKVSHTTEGHQSGKNTLRSLLTEFTSFHRVFPGIVDPNIGMRRNMDRLSLDALGGGGRAPVFQRGVSVDGPYAEFMARELVDEVSAETKFAFFAQTRWYANKQVSEASIERPEELIMFDARDILGYEKPESAEELFQVIDDLMEIGGGLQGSQATLLKYLINTEIYAYLSLEKDETLDVKRLFDLCKDGFSGARSYMRANFTVQFLGHELMSHSFAKEHNKRFLTLLDRQLSYMFHAHSEHEGDVEEFFQVYAYLNHGDYQNTSFFDRNCGLKEQYETKIQERYEQVDDPFMRTRLLRDLLCNTKLTNPSFRQWVSDEWVKVTGHILNEGLQNEYGESISLSSKAQDITQNAQMGQAVFLLNGLLEEIEAQEDDAFMVRDKLKEQFLRKGLKQDLVATANDFVLERIGDEPKIRMDFIEFITSPYNEQNANNFIEAVKGLGDRYQRDFLHFLQEDQDDKGLDITLEMKMNALQNVYSNFWGLPFAARTLYLERVLFPVDEHSDEAFEDAVTYITDKMLPEGEPYMNQARLILSTHLAESSKPLKRLIFSALMTANEHNETASGKMRPGQILSHVLGRSGAAGGKILQAAHSYLQSLPDPDQDLQAFIDDLQASKSNYNKLFRWDMLQRVAHVFVPKKGRPNPRIGKQFGAGSYGFTVELDYLNGLKTALTVAREDVGEEASYHFKWFKRTAEKLSLVDAFWSPLINILGNAQEMSAVESDFNIGAEQIQYAENLYNGISVKADGYRFDIATASLHHHGQEFKETDVAHGEHFLDLPEATQEDRRYKQAAAKALLCAEIHAILKGGAFDYDRHGAQCKLQGQKIVLFDHGSIPYDVKGGNITEPSAEDKHALGVLLAESYNEAQSSQEPLSRILISKMNDVEQFEDSAHYIECFKRGLLALNDYLKYAGEDQVARDKVVQESIAQSIKTGMADASIIEGFQQHTQGRELSAKSAYTLLSSSVILTDAKGKSLIQQGISYLFNRLGAKGKLRSCKHAPIKKASGL